MGAFDFLFGGVDDSGQDATIQSNRERMQFIEGRANAARQDVLSLFPAAQTALASGIGGALDTIRGSVPQQINALEQGNRNAQSIALGGLGGINDAILGNPQDFSPENLQQGVSNPLAINTDFLGSGLPDFLLSSQVGIPGTNGAFTPGTPIPAGTPAAGQDTIAQLFEALLGSNQPAAQQPAATQAPQPVLGDSLPTSAFGQFESIVGDFRSGAVDIGTGTRQVAALAGQLGLSDAQAAQQLGLTLGQYQGLISEHVTG